jgi:hypothetical protein
MQLCYATLSKAALADLKHTCYIFNWHTQLSAYGRTLLL